MPPNPHITRRSGGVGREVAAGLRCDVPGCPEEMAIRVGAEQRCFAHALERANELRRDAGKPPIGFDEDGSEYVVQ